MKCVKVHVSVSKYFESRWLQALQYLFYTDFGDVTVDQFWGTQKENSIP